MGLDPKGRAFYWRTPSRSNAPFLKDDEDLAPKRRAFRSASPISPKPPPVGYHAGPGNTPLSCNDPGRDSSADTSGPPLGGRSHSGPPEERRATGGPGRRAHHLRWRQAPAAAAGGARGAGRRGPGRPPHRGG